MTWNYRVFKDEYSLSIREAYYDDEGALNMWTEKGVRVFVYEDEGVDALREQLEKMLEALDKDVVDV